MKKVAFVCVHNACRSQIAEAVARKTGKGIFEAFSAGTDIAECINADAVRIMKNLGYGDISRVQKPKILKDIPPVDIVITMGCNVQCPFVQCEYREDWGLDDPTGKGDEAFLQAVREIEAKMKILTERIKNM